MISSQEIWTDEKINSLLGFETPESSQNQGEITDSEMDFDSLTLEEETEKSSSPKRTFAKNPWAKLGVIGGGLGIVFVVLGVIISQTMSFDFGKSVTAVESSGKKTDAETPPNKPSTPESTIATLKAEVALAQQNDQMTRMKQRVDTQAVKPSQPKPQTQLVIAKPEKELIPRPTVQLPPRTQAQKPVNSFSRSVTPIVSLPPPQLVSPPSSLTPSLSGKTVDPWQRWQQLAQLGSYGGKTDQAVGNSPLGTLSSNRFSTQIPQESIQGKTEQANPVISSQGETSLTAPSLEEASILSETRLQQLQVGQLAKGKLITPIIWAGTSQGEKTTTPERFIVQLESPFTDAQGKVILAKDTQLVFEMQGIHSSGLVKSEAVAFIREGKEYKLPQGTLRIRGEAGNPLIAGLQNSGTGEMMAADVSTFILGALAKTGEILNQADTSTFVSGGVVTQTSQRNQPNYLGALLEGGFSPLSQQLQRRNQQAVSQLEQRPQLWVVEAQTPVQVFVNQSFGF